MNFDRPETRLRGSACLALLLLTSCATDAATSPPIVGQGAASPFHALAFTADVNTRARTVTITPPSVVTAGAPTLSASGAEVPSLSLLGGDVVRILISNYRISAVGAYAPNKVRVTFDVRIENRLAGIRLVTPTWPVPPAAAVILFPIDYAVTYAPGGVTGGDANTVLVEQPRYGTVTASPDFDGTGAAGSGAPYSFFNDTECSSLPSSDCFRWEAFDAEILQSAGSSTRTIGFDIDPSVAQFRARMIVAADLAPAAATRAVTSPSGVAATVHERVPPMHVVPTRLERAPRSESNHP